MMFKHSLLSYSKFILKSASCLIILLITFSQCSILDFENSYSNQTLENEEEELANNKINAPQSASNYLVFQNSFLKFIIDEKGCIDDAYWNLKYQGLYNDWYYMSYLSINDGKVQPFSNFTVVKSLTNLTDFTNGGFTSQLVGETIIQHPDENVFVKVQIKLYPDEEFFVMSFMIWSDSIDIDKAELFIYDDIDVDSYSNDDDALYSSSTELISGNDKVNDTQLGWTSPHSITSWDMGDPYDIEDNVKNDALAETTSLNLEDISLATKYQREILNINDIWTVPLIYGFGTSYSNLVTNTVDVKNYFINDYSVLDFTANLTNNPSVNATILNGGQNNLTRMVSVFRNGIYLQNQNITLNPGELGNVNFDNLILNSGEQNEITVSVNNSVNDYAPNNNISHTYQYQDRFRINVKDLDGFNIEGLNISLYEKGTSTLIISTFTDDFGNVTFIDLPEDDYTLKAYVPWVNNQIIYEENLTYVEDDEYYQIQTNLTTLILHIKDVEENSVESASIDIYEVLEPETIIWSGVTDQNGNVTFLFLNQTYNINVTYLNYEKSVLLEPILDLNLIEKTNYVHQVSLTNLTFHLRDRNDANPKNLTGAKLEFYERVNETSFGNYIGFEIADSIENVSIRWDARINYSIRVIHYEEHKPIGDPEADSLNFTESPYDSYYYLDFNVSIEDYDYLTEIILFNSTPIIYTWEDNIDFKFMINVSGPSYVGPKWADETFITIQNQNFETVYDENATIISGEPGNHSFVLNTSSGFFTSNNPETYIINIFAQIESYDNPVPIILPFNIYNITTDMDLHSSSETLYWKDNFTISANYFEATDNDKTIKDGYATVSWGNNLINYPMQNLGNGTYTIEIDSSIGSPGNTVVNVKCYRENYNYQERKFYLNVMEVPTTVNGSILFDSRHSQYVTTQNLTLEYNFTDSYRNISIPNLSPMYQLICSETDEKYTGYLTYTESGVYLFDPKSALLPIGTYHGLIDFSLDNYHSSYASVQYEIFSIPTSLNDTTIPGIPYELNCYSSFILDLQYLNSYEVGTVNHANTSYIVENYFTNENFTGELDEISDGLYRFDPNSEILPIGTYSVDIFFEKANYTSLQTDFTFKINEIPLLLTFEGGSTDDENDLIASTEYSIVRGEFFYYSINILDIYENPVQDCNISYQLKMDGQVWNGFLLTDNMGHYFGNLSEFSEVGLYSLSLTVYKANYTIETLQVHINVEYPEIFGISLPYVLIGALITLIAISAVVGYVGIKRMKIPRYIKDLTKLEKILKNKNNILPDSYPTRIEQLKGKYGNRWEQIDLQFPLQPQIDEIKNFINAYQEISGKLFLKEEAKQFLDDLVIYSEDEIKRRLEEERIFGENLSKLMEIILNYIKVTSTQHDLEFDSDKVKDDFDLEFGDDK